MRSYRTCGYVWFLCPLQLQIEKNVFRFCTQMRTSNLTKLFCFQYMTARYNVSFSVQRQQRPNTPACISTSSRIETAIKLSAAAHVQNPISLPHSHIVLCASYHQPRFNPRWFHEDLSWLLTIAKVLLPNNSHWPMTLPGDVQPFPWGEFIMWIVARLKFDLQFWQLSQIGSLGETGKSLHEDCIAIPKGYITTLGTPGRCALWWLWLEYQGNRFVIFVLIAEQACFKEPTTLP